jgi:hypothetical protein
MWKNPNLGTYSQNQYAAGSKRYGLEARRGPNGGNVDPLGYAERDRKNAVKKAIYSEWLKARKNGANGSAAVLRRG